MLSFPSELSGAVLFRNHGDAGTHFRGDDGPRHPDRAAQKATPESKLAFHCASPCTFRQGESILLDLDFTANTPNPYKLLTNYNDRDMAREEFNITPQEGSSDPLAPYEHLVPVSGGSFHWPCSPSRKH
jgi:hypothetical protein